jgi:hypothetical protein
MLFNNWDRLLWLSSNLSVEEFHLNTWTDKILASVHNPLDGGNDKNDTKCRNTVVCYRVRLASNATIVRNGRNSLMLLPVAGNPGGKRNRIVVREI